MGASGEELWSLSAGSSGGGAGGAGVGAGLGEVATDRDGEGFQEKWYGCRLMALVEGQLAGEGVRECELHSRMNVADFYEKLGYEREGEVFEEIGLPHVKMRKELRPFGILKETNEKAVGR